MRYSNFYFFCDISTQLLVPLDDVSEQDAFCGSYKNAAVVM